MSKNKVPLIRANDICTHFFIYILYTHSHFVWNPYMWDSSHLHRSYTKCECVQITHFLVRISNVCLSNVTYTITSLHPFLHSYVTFKTTIGLKFNEASCFFFFLDSKFLPKYIKDTKRPNVQDY